MKKQIGKEWKINHDDNNKFKQYFPQSRFVNEPWWGGNYDGILNSYQLMTIGREDYLFANNLLIRLNLPE